MSAPASSHDKPDIKALLEAVTHNPNDQTLSHLLIHPQWAVLSGYMQSSMLAPGQILITQGAEDRTVYFVESGMLTVHFEDAAGKIRLAAVGAGSVVVVDFSASGFGLVQPARQPPGPPAVRSPAT
jgi:CRP-like cAMP-binding protein